VRTGVFSLSPVAHFLKVVIEHARITDETHLLRIFNRINSNEHATPGTSNLILPIRVSFVLCSIHDFLRGLKVHLQVNAIRPNRFKRKQLAHHFTALSTPIPTPFQRIA
jgi:hypothetical protein